MHLCNDWVLKCDWVLVVVDRALLSCHSSSAWKNCPLLGLWFEPLTNIRLGFELKEHVGCCILAHFKASRYVLVVVKVTDSWCVASIYRCPGTPDICRCEHLHAIGSSLRATQVYCLPWSVFELLSITIWLKLDVSVWLAGHLWVSAVIKHFFQSQLYLISGAWDGSFRRVSPKDWYLFLCTVPFPIFKSKTLLEVV